MGGERGGGSGGGGCWRNTRERAGGEERSGAWAARSEVASADQHQQDQSIIIGRFGASAGWKIWRRRRRWMTVLRKHRMKHRDFGSLIYGRRRTSSSPFR